MFFGEEPNIDRDIFKRYVFDMHNESVDGYTLQVHIHDGGELL